MSVNAWTGRDDLAGRRDEPAPSVTPDKTFGDAQETIQAGVTPSCLKAGEGAT